MNTIVPNLGGHTIVRNALRLDYCVSLCIESMLKVCDQVVVSESDSTDGTREALDRWAEREPRLKIVSYPWPKPVRQSHVWFLKWIDHARSNLDTKFQIAADADEVIDDSPECHAAIREACQSKEPARWWRRNNYWKSPRLLTPITGGPCANRVVRIGLTADKMPSDQPAAPGEFRIIDTAMEDDRLLVHHLGFLRRRDAFYRKAHVMLDAWFGRHDLRLEEGEKKGLQLWDTECDFSDKLRPFDGHLPKPVIDWFRERGHIV